MPIQVYKPTSPGRRRASGQDFSDVTKTQPEKSLTEWRKRKAGRNNQGRITTHHQGSGAKRLYRKVDFDMRKFDLPATVLAVEYDPYRSARIALVQYADQQKSYVLAPDGLKVGDNMVSSLKSIEIKTGNRMPLEHIPVGLSVYNVELAPGKGGEVVRSAGNSAQVLAKEGDQVQLKMPSGEIRNFFKQSRATIGVVSNPDWRNVRWGKAGRSRLRGIRPTVRGKAKNPVDHPHGGGEGNQPIGLKHPKTPWGKPALGVPTRKDHKRSDAFIVRRRPKRVGKIRK